MKKKRVNPNRIPVSKATVCDKFGYDSDSLQDVWKEVNALSDGVVKGYVNVNDLLQVLDEEYGIMIKV
ncbi:MAG: hypothetical protein J6J01_06705 [Oscillospiraceae bacterium]|nr:hypothetical protein [Oscillospiraceae bacterium]